MNANLHIFWLSKVFSISFFFKSGLIEKKLPTDQRNFFDPRSYLISSLTHLSFSERTSLYGPAHFFVSSSQKCGELSFKTVRFFMRQFLISWLQQPRIQVCIGSLMVLGILVDFVLTKRLKNDIVPLTILIGINFKKKSRKAVDFSVWHCFCYKNHKYSLINLRHSRLKQAY